MKTEYEGVETFQLLEGLGCVHRGHFELEDGRHTNGYLSKIGLLQKPMALLELSRRVVDQFDVNSYDFVVGPVNFGAQFAALAALNYNKPFSMVFVPRVDHKFVVEKGTFHEDFRFEPGQRALLVDNWTVTGRTLRAVVTFLESKGVSLAGIGLIGKDRIFSTDKVKTLFEFPFERSTKADCRMCLTEMAVELSGIRE